MKKLDNVMMLITFIALYGVIISYSFKNLTAIKIFDVLLFMGIIYNIKNL